MVKRSRLLLTALAALASGLALAASPAASQEAVSERPTTRAADRPAWYRDQLITLAATLGGAHYIRLRCTRDDYSWFTFMEGMIRHEDAQMRLQLEDAFNAGFRRERARFGACTPAAQQAEAELRARGMRIADGLGAANES